MLNIKLRKTDAFLSDKIPVELIGCHEVFTMAQALSRQSHQRLEITERIKFNCTKPGIY